MYRCVYIYMTTTEQLQCEYVTAQMPLGYDNFNSIAIRSWSQGWRVFRINRQRRLVIVARIDLSFTSVFCSQKHTALGLSGIPSEVRTFLLHNQR